MGAERDVVDLEERNGVTHLVVPRLTITERVHCKEAIVRIPPPMYAWGLLFKRSLQQNPLHRAIIKEHIEMLDFAIPAFFPRPAMLRLLLR